LIYLWNDNSITGKNSTLLQLSSSAPQNLLTIDSFFHSFSFSIEAWECLSIAIDFLTWLVRILALLLLLSLLAIVGFFPRLLVSRSATATVTLFIIASATAITALSAVSVVLLATSVVVVVVPALVACSSVATSPVGGLVVIVIGLGLAREGHGVLDLLDSGFGLFIDRIRPLALHAGVILTLEEALVVRQLRFALDLLHFASYFKRVTERDQALVDVFELLDLRWW